MSVYSWAQRHREEGQWGLMTRKEREEQLRTPTKAALEKSLPDDPAELKKQLAQLLVDKAILEKELDLVKKDVSVIPGQLTNKQKTDVVDALRRTWPLPLLLASIGLPASSFYYHLQRRRDPDKHAYLREELHRNRCCSAQQLRLSADVVGVAPSRSHSQRESRAQTYARRRNHTKVSSA